MTQGIDELKSLVADTLKKQGVLGKFKAQLRKTVISVLDADSNHGLYNENAKAATICSTDDGLLMAELICEFMAFYNLEYTESVFVPEVNLPTGATRQRAQLRELLKMPQDDTSLPLLTQVLTTFLRDPIHASAGPSITSAPPQPSLHAPVVAKADDETAEDFTPDFDSADDGTPARLRDHRSISAILAGPGSPIGDLHRMPSGDDDVPFSDHSATASDIEGFTQRYHFVEEVHTETLRRTTAAVAANDDSDSDHF